MAPPAHAASFADLVDLQAIAGPVGGPWTCGPVAGPRSSEMAASWDGFLPPRS